MKKEKKKEKSVKFIDYFFNVCNPFGWEEHLLYFIFNIIFFLVL